MPPLFLYIFTELYALGVFQAYKAECLTGSWRGSGLQAARFDISLFPVIDCGHMVSAWVLDTGMR